jgi:hypothetical protein
MTLKEEKGYFTSEISPYEQYRRMLETEKLQRQSDTCKGLYKYIPQESFIKQGIRTQLVKEIF